MGQFTVRDLSRSVRGPLERASLGSSGDCTAGTGGSASVAPPIPRGPGPTRFAPCALPRLPWRPWAAAPRRRLGRCPGLRRSPAPLCRSRACRRLRAVGELGVSARPRLLRTLRARVLPVRVLLPVGGDEAVKQRRAPTIVSPGPERSGSAIFVFLTRSQAQIRASPLPVAAWLAVGGTKQKGCSPRSVPFSALKTTPQKKGGGEAWEPGFLLCAQVLLSPPPPPTPKKNKTGKKKKKHKQTQQTVKHNFRAVAFLSKFLSEFPSPGHWGGDGGSRGHEHRCGFFGVFVFLS